MRSQHIVRKAALEDNDGNRWYDNPDLSDLLFATFNNEQFRDHSVCLDMYRPEVGGFVNTRLRSGNFQSDFVSTSGNDEKPLQDKIVYKSILTVSTTDPAAITAKLDSVLNGIDRGQDGMPKLILVPVLMHRDHFGIFAIEPNADPAQTKVSYFNPKGAMRGYSNEETPMLAYMRKRYPGGTVQCNDASETAQGESAIYQRDGASCGPFVTQFAINTARLAIAGTSPASRFNTNNNHCGLTVQRKLTEDTIEAAATYDSTLSMRQEQARNLDSSVMCNYTFWLFNQAQDRLNQVEQGEQIASPVTFAHKGISANAHERVVGTTPQIQESHLDVLNIWNIDFFEMQPATISEYSGLLNAGTSLSNLPLDMGTQNADIKIAATVIAIVLALAGAGVGISYGLGAF